MPAKRDVQTRRRKPPSTATTRTNELTTGELEKRLWASADALRNNMDAAEYKHVALGLIFLKYREVAA